MTKKKPNLVFLGTPDFAVASLEAILKAGYPVTAVVTAPDKPAGRGMKLTATAVKQFADQQGIPVLQPVKLKDPDFLSQLAAAGAAVQAVVAFRMLPELVWNMPPMGTVNLHGSLLPQYRGAAPINRAVMNGEPETGVTTFLLQQQIDTGNILMMEKMPVGPDETAGEVHDRMKILGAEVLVKTLDALVAGKLKGIPQDGIAEGQILIPAPKILAEDLPIDWHKPVSLIHNHIRGLSPYPGAYTQLDEKMFKILKSSSEPVDSPVIPGKMETDGKQWMRFAGANGYIYAQEVQAEGKKKMNIADFLRGYRQGRSG